MSNYIILCDEYVNATWLHLTSFFFGCDRVLLQTEKTMTNLDKINATLLKDLLSTVKDLQSKVAALKSRATGGTNLPTITTQSGDEPGQDAQLLHGSGMGDNNSPPAKKRKENREKSNEEAADSSNDEDNTFTLSKARTAFMEATFKTKLNAAARKKKISSLGFLIVNRQNPWSWKPS